MDIWENPEKFWDLIEKRNNKIIKAADSFYGQAEFVWRERFPDENHEDFLSFENE